MSQKEEFTLTRTTFSSRKASAAHDSKRTSAVALDDGASLCMLQTCGSIACRSCGIEAASACCHGGSRIHYCSFQWSYVPLLQFFDGGCYAVFLTRTTVEDLRIHRNAIALNYAYTGLRRLYNYHAYFVFVVYFSMQILLVGFF